MLGLAAALGAVGCSREPAAARIAKGQQALREGRYREAADHLRRAARSKPESMVLHYNLGMAELERGRLGQAADAFSQAAELTTDGATDALEGLARARQLQERWDAASLAYERAVKQAGRLPRLLAGMAAIELKNGRGELALSLLTEALAQNPNEPTSLYNMACLQRDAFQDPAAAAAYFARFLEAAPESEAAARDRAGQALTALGDVRGATSLRAENLIVRSRQAATADESVALAERAVAEDPLSADALWNLCGVLVKHGGEKERALRAYAKFARLFPSDGRTARIPAGYQPVSPERALAAAKAAVSAAKWPAAVAAFQQVLAVDDRSPEVWLDLSAAAQNVPDLDTALDAASKALSLRPGYPEATYRLGLIQYQLGRRDAAIEHIRRYLELIPDGPHKTAVAKFLKDIGG
jgi:tetratricopeptide (TPR) repeat protein